MMLRHEEGRWLLDDPIELHLPEFTRLEGPAGEKLRHRPTMRELLTHGAGFAYGVGMGGLDEAEAAYLAAGVWDRPRFPRWSAASPMCRLPASPGQLGAIRLRWTFRARSSSGFRAVASPTSFASAYLSRWGWPIRDFAWQRKSSCGLLRSTTKSAHRN